MPAFLPDTIQDGVAVFLEDAPHIARTLRPVSYTHLDVYKRQVLYPKQTDFAKYDTFVIIAPGRCKTAQTCVQ